METLQSLTGIGGGPLGTERPSAFFPGTTGQAFAEEVERAEERARGDGPAARRQDLLAGERRAARRAGFDGPDAARAEEPERAETKKEGSREPEWLDQGPVRATAFQERSSPVGGDPSGAPSQASAAPSSPQPLAEGSGVMEGTAPLPSAAPAAVAPTTNPAAVAATAPEASAPAAAGEAKPVALAPARADGPRAEPAATGEPAPAPAPGEAALERAEEILRQIKLHLAPGVKRLVLDLDPLELGRLAVQLAWRAGKVSAIVRAERGETLALLAQRENDLGTLLAQRGIAADSVRLELGFQGQRRGGQAAPPPSAPTPPSNPAHVALERDRTVHPSDPASRALVDTYA